MPRAKDNPTKASISIRGDLTIDTVSGVLGQMRSALPSRDITVDLSDLKKIDLAGLQLLYSLDRTVRAAGGTVRVQGESAIERLTRMVLFTGLRSPAFLELPDER